MSDREHFIPNTPLFCESAAGREPSLTWSLLREVAAGRQLSLTVLLDRHGEPLWMAPAAESLWYSPGSNLLRNTMRTATAVIAPDADSEMSRFRAELGRIPCLVEISRWNSDSHLLLARLTVDVPRRLAIHYGLTDAEVRVAELVSAGGRNIAIAKSLNVSPHTVRTHVSRVLQKFGTDCRAKVAACWAEARFFDADAKSIFRTDS